MAIAFTYGADAGSSASATTITRAATLTSGNGVVVWVYWGSSTITITGVADGTNTYLQAGTTVVDSTRGHSAALFYCKNAATGTPTITATFSLATANRAIAYIKVSGHDTTANAQTGKGQAQGATGTGTDAATTTAMTPTAQPNGVFAVCISQINGPTVTAGTGYTALSTIVGYNAIASDTSGTEWKRTTSVSAVAGTFTLSASDEPNNIGIIISEAGGGGGGASPFIPIDFFLYTRLPRPQNYQASARTDLLGKDKFFGAAGLAPDFDWPNPVGLRVRAQGWPIDLRTFIDPSEFWMLKDTFFGGAGKPPEHDPIPNPRGYVGLDNRNFTDASEFWMLKDTFFGAAGQPPTYQPPPNPRGYPYPTDIRTWAESLSLELYGKDTFFGGPGQSPHYDYPNPRVAGFPLELRTLIENLLQTTLAPTTAPFFMVDWPNPQVRQFPLEDRTFTDASEFWLLKDQFFGLAGHPNHTWPNPQTKVSRAQMMDVLNLLETTLGTTSPVVTALRRLLMGVGV